MKIKKPGQICGSEKILNQRRRLLQLFNFEHNHEIVTETMKMLEISKFPDDRVKICSFVGVNRMYYVLLFSNINIYTGVYFIITMDPNKLFL